MQGDIIIVEEHHREAAAAIVDAIADEIAGCERRYTITVAGESGSGKSETARALADALEDRGTRCAIYQQDDYFHLPPRSNAAKRREDIGWVGTQEVKLELLDAHLAAARAGEASVDKPLVRYAEDRIDQETLSLVDVEVVIAEGTYTTLLEQVDKRIFIARNRLETLAARQRRGREAMDPFTEQVLEIEHAIIAPHRERADIVITKDYDVEL